MNQECVYRFPKNETEEVRFSLREYKGRSFVDIRLFFQAKEGEYLPTKKGLTLSVDHFGPFMNGVEKLSEELLTVKGGAR